MHDEDQQAARSTYVRDSISTACVGVAGWGAAPLVGHPGWAIPALGAGVCCGAGLMVTGRRRHYRQTLALRTAASLAPLLSIPGRLPASAVRVDRWTNGWPGSPRRVRVRYGTGRLKLADGSTEVGETRWAAELAKLVGARFGGTYLVHSNDSGRGRLTLRLRPPVEDEAKAKTPQVQRATRVVSELLGSGATVTKLDVDDAGEVRRMQVRHEVGAKLVAPGYRRRVERTVTVMLPGRWRAKWDMEADAVTFEVRPTLPESLWIPPLELPDTDPLKNYREVCIPYGVDEDGEVIAWRPAVTPQWLITGQTGSGKTSTAHGVLAQITQFGWPVWVADGKGIEFLGFQGWPNVQIVASRIEEQVAVIHRAWQVMEQRYDLVVERKARPEDFVPLMVFVDEFTDLNANLTTWYSQIKVKGDPTKPPTLSEVGSIARKGRTARVHLVLSMQRPDQNFFAGAGGDTRDNFGQRTSMGPLGPHGAEMMWGNQVTGVTLPRGKVGRAIGINGQGVPVEMQAYRVPDPMDSLPGTTEGDLIEKLRPREARHERLLIVPPKIDWDGEDPVEPTFTHYAEAEWVRAADRPDLDPLAAGEASGSTRVDGRRLSSPMTLLGLTPGDTSSAWERRVITPDQVGRLEEEQADGTSTAAVTEFVDGYGSASPVRVAELQIGDLIRVDEDLDSWAVVEEEPVPDFDDDDSLVIAWRNDNDESGELIVAGEAVISRRRPLEGSE